MTAVLYEHVAGFRYAWDANRRYRKKLPHGKIFFWIKLCLGGVLFLAGAYAIYLNSPPIAELF